MHYSDSHLLKKFFFCLKCMQYYSKNLNKITSKNSIVANYVQRQMTDEYSKLARAHNYRARSAFKLIELNKKLNLIKKGDNVLDVGAAPGSWSQVISEILHCKKNDEFFGYILAIDLQFMHPIKNVDIMSQADITKNTTHNEIKKRLNNRFFDLILSDMAPNPTGNAQIDHERIIGLCQSLFSYISLDQDKVLPLIKGGKFLCKIWDGYLQPSFVKELQNDFKYVKVLKPKASRDHSAEIYLYANGYKLS